MNLVSLEENNELLLQIQPRLKELEAKLLSIGGKNVFLQFEIDIDNLLKNGTVWKDKIAINQLSSKICFTMVYNFKVNNPDNNCWFGWFLGGNTWRQHACGISDNMLIDFGTLLGTKYFGIVNSDDCNGIIRTIYTKGLPSI